jgi:ethanolamine utilization protein EutA (predicted chaperonin)
VSPEARAVVRRVGLIVAVGVGTGAVTQFGQSVLPDGWSQAANAISPWLLVAFLLGSVMPDARWAVVAGVGALAFALVGYYGMTQLRYGIGGGTSSLIFWGLGAIVGGPVFGTVGRWWRGPTHRRRAMAMGLLAAAAIADGLYNGVVLGYTGPGVGFIVAGLWRP